MEEGYTITHGTRSYTLGKKLANGNFGNVYEIAGVQDKVIKQTNMKDDMKAEVSRCLISAHLGLCFLLHAPHFMCLALSLTG